MLFLGRLDGDVLTNPVNSILIKIEMSATISVSNQPHLGLRGLTFRPSAEVAEHAWICQARSRMVTRCKASASSPADTALMRSCLLA